MNDIRNTVNNQIWSIYLLSDMLEANLMSLKELATKSQEFEINPDFNHKVKQATRGNRVLLKNLCKFDEETQINFGDYADNLFELIDVVVEKTNFDPEKVKALGNYIRDRITINTNS